MRPLTELDGVAWAALVHAYGTASDVPDLLRALVTDQHEHALHALYGRIVHQGSRYGATAHAVPFLLGLVADPATPARGDLLLLLAAVAIGDDETCLPAGIDVEGWRAPELAAYEAVLAGAPMITELLDDPSPEVRVAALYVLAWLPAAESAPCVRTLLVGAEPDGVVATAVVTLGLLGVSPATVRPYLGHPCAAVRWAAAIALARLGHATPAVVETLTAFVAEPPAPTDPPVPFHKGDYRGYATRSLAAPREPAPLHLMQ